MKNEKCYMENGKSSFAELVAKENALVYRFDSPSLLS
jgi:hypothetical protein